jgi:capsular exopolysaccharide synthesis family protein
MATPINQKPAAQNPQDFIRIQDLFYLCLARWKWFVLSMVICLGAATIYLLKTPPVFTRTASILIKDDSKGGGIGGGEDFSNLGLFANNSNIANEMGTLRSPDLMREVVERLHLNFDYQLDGAFHRTTIYGSQLPVVVDLPDLPENASATFLLRLLGDGRYELTDLVKDGVEQDGDLEGKVGETLATPLGKMDVKPGKSYQKDQRLDLFVTRNTLAGATGAFGGGLTIAKDEEATNIIILSYLDVSTQRAEDILNTLIAVYNENWVKEKNQIAVSTSLFINDRINVIEGELGNVENDISNFKSENLMIDPTATAGLYESQMNNTEMSLMDLNNQAYMARYVRNYVTNDANKFQLIPSTTGMGSENVSGLIGEYNSQILERNTLVAQSSERNPLVIEMDKTLSTLRANLVASIDNQLMVINTQIKTQKNIGGQATSRLASSPKKANYLLSVERQQKVKESLYLFLLQKREENELSQAFTAYNTRIINQPSGSMIPTAPIKKNILLVAFALGLLIPVVIVFVQENTNTVVRGRKDLASLTLPFVGEIPYYHSGEKRRFYQRRQPDQRRVVVREGSRDVVNEAFRVLRTNLEFMTNQEAASNVILLTSFNPGSGKSFLSLNIAVSLAIKGKKVLVIDGDLRHGSTSAYVDSPSVGLSDYLNGRVPSVDDILVTYQQYEHLQILPVGTIPPNPTELLYEPRLKQAIDDLKTRYDYVLIDCPPVEMLADTQIIEQYADRTIFVIRAGLLERSMLPELETIYNEKKYKNMSVILNGTEGTTGRYGSRYGYKYGYGYRYGYGYHNGYGYTSYYGSEKKKK